MIHIVSKIACVGRGATALCAKAQSYVVQSRQCFGENIHVHSTLSATTHRVTVVRAFCALWLKFVHCVNALQLMLSV
jgi:hypothetical protein